MLTFFYETMTRVLDRLGSPIVLLYIYSVEMLFIICWISDRDDLDSRPQIWGRHTHCV